MKVRTPNSQECLYRGYKLSNIEANIETNGMIQVCVGCYDDDTFYSNNCKCGRVKVTIESENEYYEIDLEDILVFARQHCNGIYERVLHSIKPCSE